MSALPQLSEPWGSSPHPHPEPQLLPCPCLPLLCRAGSKQGMTRRMGELGVLPSPTSNASSDTPLNEHTCVHTQVPRDLYTRTQIRTPLYLHRPSGAQVGRQGTRHRRALCLAWGEGMALVRVTGRPVPIPSPCLDDLYKAGSICTLPSALHLGVAGGHQVLSPNPGQAWRPSHARLGVLRIAAQTAPRGQGGGRDGACRPLGAQWDDPHPCPGSPGLGPKLRGAQLGQWQAACPSWWVGGRAEKLAGWGAVEGAGLGTAGPRQLPALSQAQALL